MKALSGAVFYKESIEISTLNIKHRLYVWFWSAKKIVKRRNFVLDQPGAARQINYDSKMLSRYTVHTADSRPTLWAVLVFRKTEIIILNYQYFYLEGKPNAVLPLFNKSHLQMLLCMCSVADDILPAHSICFIIFFNF